MSQIIKKLSQTLLLCHAITCCLDSCYNWGLCYFFFFNCLSW